MRLKGVLSMIRFRCPQCDKALNVPEEKAGATFVCPRCKERIVAPTGETIVATGEPTYPEEQSPEPGGSDLHPSSSWNQALEQFSGMSLGLKWVVVLVAGVGVCSLLLAILALFLPVGWAVADSAPSWAMLLVPSSAVILLVIFYGHATCCPLCGQWWARNKYATEFVGREVFDKGNDSFARSTYKTVYQCGSCRHRWSATFTEEFKELMKDRLKRRVEGPRRRRVDQ
jgi:hypothetical protein